MRMAAMAQLSDGLRDSGLLSSTPACPENAPAYDSPNAAGLAAAYAVWIAKNHPFVDGNKPTVRVVTRLFILQNHCRLEFRPERAVAAVEALAAGTLDEKGLAASAIVSRSFNDTLRRSAVY